MARPKSSISLSAPIRLERSNCPEAQTGKRRTRSSPTKDPQWRPLSPGSVRLALHYLLPGRARVWRHPHGHAGKSASAREIDVHDTSPRTTFLKLACRLELARMEFHEFRTFCFRVIQQPRLREVRCTCLDASRAGAVHSVFCRP